MTNLVVAILGAGSWGTAVAIHLARGGHTVILWGRDKQHVLDMQKSGCNQRYLPDTPFPSNLQVDYDLQNCLEKASEIIIAVPSHSFSSILDKIPKPKNGLAWLTKGIDPKTNKPLSELVYKKWGDSYPIAVVSGPSFAKEVAKGLPTTLVIAGNDINYLSTITASLHNNNLRCYSSNDLLGVQIAGAVKNILAIACGISDGLNYGANAKAALITRGLLEMIRLGTSLGASQETFMGLAGVGDLVLTCTDNQSRNRRFGIQLGQGISSEDALTNIGQVVEGSKNAKQIFEISTESKIDMPICHEVYAILQGTKSPKDAALDLMNRPLQPEF
ncbi:MAG: NAD(P)-dependent glycerol-3-phosphate dehydrogenase [Legionellaceae bacterium]|nr:NAD(P)-dependent glycerol-3-phosphate dehydrogenase [Legionellaceae bacterium]